MPPFRPSPTCRGFTLVELLVVVAILAALMALVIPAVQGVRESGRRMQCQGNVRQLAQACRNYENANGTLPTQGDGGWPGSAQNGGRLGDPNATGLAAGGWLYVILPFIEQQPLFDLGFGLTSTALHNQMKIRIGTAVPLYTCPNRGSPLFQPPTYVAGAQAIGFLNASSPVQVFATNPASAARSDYAGCWAQGDGALENFVGRGRQFRSIIDGHANVFLCGERYLSPDNYNPTAAANFECNNRGWSVCSEGDVYASGVDQSGTALPLLQDARGVSGCVTCLAYSGTNCWPFPSRFGSPHSGVPMGMVDGSVRVVSFDIQPSVFASICRVSDSSGAAEDLD